jgi:predicted DNA-binding transcriptional regulator AlpA
MDEVHMLTRSELAQRWRVSKSFLDKQMVLAPETLPPFVKIGRQTRFPLQEVIRWENERLSRLIN